METENKMSHSPGRLSSCTLEVYESVRTKQLLISENGWKYIKLSSTIVYNRHSFVV